MIRAGLAGILALLLFAGVAAADSPTAYTHPDRWEFLGSLSFDVVRLRDALAADVDVLLASRMPQNPEALATVLAERLTAGYRHSGFPDAVVTGEVLQDQQRIALVVVEGSHYRNGDVRVEGAVTLPVQELIAGLTQGTGPKDAFLRWSLPPEQGGVKEWFKPSGERVIKEAAVWKKEASTSFGSNLERSITEKAVLILQRLGYMEPAVSARLEPQADGQTTLVIQIENEGPRAVLGEIEVHGNALNSSEQILGYLNVKPGQELDTDSASRWQWTLQESVRFYETRVEITAPPFGPGPSRLDIHVVEIPELPTLSEPLTPLQQAATRAARWMTGPKQEDWQLRLSVEIDEASSKFLPWAWQGAKKANLCWTFSTADHAAIVEVDLVDAREQTVWAANFHLGDRELQFLNLTRGIRLSCPTVDSQVVATAHWSVRKPDQEGRSSLLNFGLGMHSREGEACLPLRLETIVAPAAILIETLRSGSTATLENGVFRLSVDSFVAAFDAETGRLLEFGNHLRDIGMQISLRAEPGLYRQRRQEQAPAYQACREIAWDAGTVTTLGLFALDTWTELTGEGDMKGDELLPLARRLLNAGVFHAIDEQLTLGKDKGVQPALQFSIPAPIVTGPVHPLAWVKPFLHVVFAEYSRVFPRDTGAWIAAREAVLALVGGRKGAVPPARVVEVLDQAEAGPISFLLATEMFQFVSPYHRYVLAHATLDRLDSPSLRSDLRVLTDERSIAGKVMLAVMTAVRDASPEDLAVIANTMTKAHFDEVLRPAFRELSRRKDEPLSQVVPDVLEQVYPALLRPLLLAELHRLETPVRAANAKPDIKPLAMPDTPFLIKPLDRKLPQPLPDITKQQFLPNRD
ncbi:MAG TPA: hypothetical protein VFG20_15120 [Planctomycetaceae bacterium]|nr:hypothetical protein [Planctomycetaceae bacterium]